MKAFVISLAILSLGPAYLFAETLPGSKKLIVQSEENAVSTNFATRFDDAMAAIERSAKETQRLREAGAKTSPPFVNSANASTSVVK